MPTVAAAKFFLLLTFSYSVPGQVTTKGITCQDMVCVDKVIDQGQKDSPYLIRVRVFQDHVPSQNKSGGTFFPPLMDIWIQ